MESMTPPPPSPTRRGNPPGPSTGPGSGRPSARRRVLLALALAAAVGQAACLRQEPRDPLGLIPRLLPFERLPYVQSVDTASATIRWLASASAPDSAEFRPGRQGPWQAAAVTRSHERASSLSGPVATRDVRLTGLEPGAEVSYRIWADTALAGPFTFRTAPRPGSGGTTRVLVFGDSGYGSDVQMRLARIMEEADADLVVHTGDIAYQDGTEEDFTLRHFQVYRQMLSHVPFFPAPGNHDLRAEGGAPYRRAFVWPAPFGDARFYSFRWGDILFVALDTTDERETDWRVELSADAGGEPPSSYTDGAELREGEGRQYDWLGEKLRAGRQDPEVRWTIVYMHHPPYSHAVGMSGHGTDVKILREVAPLFDEHGVDLVLSGHDHHYERTFPLFDDKLAEEGCGPVYILSGGGGATRFARGIAESPVQARSSLQHHFVRLEISGGLIRGTAIGDRGQTIDAFTVLPYEGADGEGDPAGPGC